MILSGFHLIIGTIISDEIFHRSDFVIRRDDIDTLLSPFKSLFGIPHNGDFMGIFKIPLHILYFVLITFSLFLKDRNIRLLFYFISFVIALEIICGLTFIDNFFIGPLSILKGLY